MRYTIEGLKAIAKVKNIPVGVPFYACEVGLKNGEINSLSWNNFIRETGNYRETFIQLYGDHYKKVDVKEWIINTKLMDERCQRVNEDLSELAEVISSFER